MTTEQMLRYVCDVTGCKSERETEQYISVGQEMLRPCLPDGWLQIGHHQICARHSVGVDGVILYGPDL